MKNVLFFIIGASLWGLGALAQNAGPLDGTPWPWGPECPVYAQFLEGTWSANSPGGRGQKVYAFFEVRVRPMPSNNMWSVSLRQLNLSGHLLAYGDVFFQQGGEGVRVPLYAQWPGRCDYWASMHSYTREPDNNVCVNESDVATTSKSLVQARFLSEQIMLLNLEPMSVRRGRVCKAKRYFLKPSE